MQSFQLSSHIDPQGILKIQLPENFANQDVDIVLVVENQNEDANVIDKKQTKEDTASFGAFLTQFRQEIKDEQLDIGTSIFDKDRHSHTEREIDL